LRCEMGAIKGDRGACLALAGTLVWFQPNQRVSSPPGHADGDVDACPDRRGKNLRVALRSIERAPAACHAGERDTSSSSRNSRVTHIAWMKRMCVSAAPAEDWDSMASASRRVRRRSRCHRPQWSPERVTMARSHWVRASAYDGGSSALRSGWPADYAQPFMPGRKHSRRKRDGALRPNAAASSLCVPLNLPIRRRTAINTTAAVRS